LLQGYLVPCGTERGAIMPKMKTRKSAAKRFKVTAGGKVLYKKQGLRHILTKKSSKRKAHLRSTGVLSDVEARRVKSMLPYE
jgi:large subunit ribosomal protein L35